MAENEVVKKCTVISDPEKIKYVEELIARKGKSVVFGRGEDVSMKKSNWIKLPCRNLEELNVLMESRGCVLGGHLSIGEPKLR